MLLRLISFYPCHFIIEVNFNPRIEVNFKPRIEVNFKPSNLSMLKVMLTLLKF
jgi:hypothetical protein